MSFLKLVLSQFSHLDTTDASFAFELVVGVARRVGVQLEQVPQVGQREVFLKRVKKFIRRATTVTK